MLQGLQDSVHLIRCKGAWVAYKLLGVQIRQKLFQDLSAYSAGLANLGFPTLKPSPGIMFWIGYVYPSRPTLS